MKEIRAGGAPLSRLIQNNLPKSLTSFVGREAEIEKLSERILAGGLFTLTGGGGSGKTRLALEVARAVSNGASSEISGGFRDGVWLVELDALVEESLVGREVASVLGVGERRSGDMVRELPEVLRSRRALIVLDNCEHLAGACAALCEALLKRCPQLAILATSREPLGVPGERVHPVPPLSVPETMGSGVEFVGESESVRLFVQRSLAVWSGFELTGENAGAVVEVCTILDGIPLAIELAASRMNIMTPKEIATRLDDALGLLATGPRTAPRRQSTLRAAIDWSYDLLPDSERRTFRALSVFSGGFTLNAAEEVCCVEEDASVMDLIQSLVGRSLLQVQRTGETSRYRFQEVIRQYAASKLGESGEAETFAMRHAVFFYGFAREAEQGLSYPDPTLWLGLVDLELDNLRQAMKWMVDAGEVDGALHIPSALAWFWLRRGRLIEARSFMERAFALGEGDPVVTAAALHVLGGLAWAQGDSKSAEPLLREAIARLRELKDFEFQDVWLSSSFFTLSLELLGSGKAEEAVSVAEESISVLREEFEETSSSARGLAALGVARLAAGDVLGAREPLERSAAICRRIGDDWTLSFPLDNLAAISLLEGEIEQAYALTRESLSALRGLEDRWLLSVSLSYFAATLAALGEARRAASLFGFGAAMREEVGQREVYAHYRTVHDRGINAAREALGEEGFAAAWGEGRAMEIEAAMTLALADGVDRPENHAPRIVISTLGGFRVEVNGRAIETSAWGYAKVRELFVYLVCNAPVKRDRIGLDLWPDAGNKQLRDALGNAMYRIRKALNGATNPFRHENGTYIFDRTGTYTLDIEEFEEKSRRAGNEDDASEKMRLLEAATNLYRGDFLEGGSGEEWVFYRQQELREIHTKNQILLGDLLAQNNDHENARNAYRRATAQAPYSTAAHAGILRSFIKQGETGRALEHHRNLQKTFREDLGAELPQEIVAIIERLRSSYGD